MKIILADDVFTGEPTYRRALHKILSAVAEGRHRIEVDEGALESWLEFQEAGLAADYRQGFRNSLRLAREEPADIATVEVVSDSEPSWADPVARLPLEQAARLLAEPLGLLLENFEHDKDFLTAHLPPWLARELDLQIKEGWVLVLNGGGSVLGAHLDERADDRVRCLRTWIMFDSDRLHPDEHDPNWDGKAPSGRDASCQALKWERTCSEIYPRRFWALHRRSIENYMPENELENSPSQELDHLDRVSAFTRMSRDQRWHFNMKKGRNGDTTEPACSRARDLYAALPEPDKLLLQGGFGRNLSDQFKAAKQRPFAWDNDARVEATLALSDLLRLL